MKRLGRRHRRYRFFHSRFENVITISGAFKKFRNRELCPANFQINARNFRIGRRVWDAYIDGCIVDLIASSSYKNKSLDAVCEIFSLSKFPAGNIVK